MLKLRGLSRTVALYMIGLVLAGLVITTHGWGLLYRFFGPEPHNDLGFTPLDYVAYGLFATLGVIMAAAAAQMLSRRIVVPLTAIAEAARKLSEGDLHVRVQVSDASLGEVAELAQDFNSMAARIERLAMEASQWNATIAHELRTPLTVLRGLVQGATDRVFEVDDEWLGMLGIQVDSLTRLVEDLRVLSLAESGHLSVQLEPVMLDDLVSEMRRMMAGPLQEAGKDVTWSLSAAPILGDRARLRQALLALLENARVHADPGPMRVSVGQEGPFAVFRVEDSGPGVPGEAAERIFNAFERGAPQPGKGSGLGLAVVSTIATAHAGAASVERSALGGAVFKLRLPATS